MHGRLFPSLRAPIASQARHHSSTYVSSPKKFRPPGPPFVGKHGPPPRKPPHKHELLAASHHVSKHMIPEVEDNQDVAAVLRALVKKTVRPPSQEATALQQGDQLGALSLDDGYLLTDNVVPGTFMEHRIRGQIIPGVTLADVNRDGKRYLAMLTSEGEIVQCNSEHAYFRIPGFISLELAARCGVELITDQPSELHARADVLKRIRQLMNAIEVVQNDLANRDVDFYSVFKSAHPDKWGKATIADATRLWSKDTSVLAIYATYRRFMDDDLHFFASHDAAVTGKFDVRPQAEVDRIQLINKWATMRQGPIEAFAQKANAVRLANADRLKESFRELQPPSRLPAKHKWSENDKTIITFLLQSLYPLRVTQSDPHDLGRSTILKKISDASTMDDAVAHQMLVELGVLAPWQDTTTIRPDLGDAYRTMDSDDENGVAESSSASVTPSKSSQVLGPEDLYPTDILESVRHDFGDLPVYVIDSEDAHELDDGISIEPVPSEPDHFWIHAHIADIASLLPPRHKFSTRARLQMESHYLLDEIRPLLPQALTTGSERGRSLGTQKGSQHVLTMSTKVDADGEILETKVRAGLVRNVQVMTYESVDAALGFPLAPKHYPFGDDPIYYPIAPINARAVEDLKLFHKFSESVVRRRQRKGIIQINKPQPQLFNFKMPADIMRTPTMEPSYFRGFPEMKFVVENIMEMDVGAHSIVAETMKMACRAASRFCIEHDIPAIRRYSTRPVYQSRESLEKVQSLRTSNGYVKIEDSVGHLWLEPLTGYSLEPKAHYTLDCAEGEGYVRVTSPLRRYTDMLAHWQITSALLGKEPTFSHEEMLEYTSSLTMRERFRRRADGQYRTWWQVSYVHRFLEDEKRREGRPNPLENLTATVLAQAPGDLASVQFDRIGLRGTMKMDYPDKSVFDPGNKIPVVITEVRTGVTPNIYCEISRMI